MTTVGDGRLPVFVVPSTLNFYADDQKTHKQILTLYNPHDFPIKFKVLCTKARKYGVVCPKGIVQPRYCIDIVVRHNAVSVSNYGVTDRFRVSVQEHGSPSVCGWKEIEARLLPGKPPNDLSSSSEDYFEQLPEQGVLQHQQHEYRMPPSPSTSRGPSVVVLVVAALCLAVLMLPDAGDQQHLQIPDYLHLTTNKKVVAAFVLGLVTMAILHS